MPGTQRAMAILEAFGNIGSAVANVASGISGVKGV